MGGVAARRIVAVVARIREMHHVGTITQVEIANRFGITKATINDIVVPASTMRPTR